MTTFHDYFSLDLIIKELCRERLKIARARHDALLFHRVSADQPCAEKTRRAMVTDLEELFPPRRKRAKFRPKRRERKSKHSQAVNLNALLRAARSLMRLTPDAPWAVKLRARANMIRDWALVGENFRFTPPLVTGIPKDPGKHQYRPISIYGTNDKIIERLTARYLRDMLDFALSPSSLAFRSKPADQTATITHHESLDRIVGFRMRHSQVFAAEADLRNFLDCIDHQVARDSLHHLIEYGKSLQPDLEIAPRAIQILDAYLASYSFKCQTLGQGLCALKKKDPQASFPWPEAQLRKMHDREDLAEIGIPQGGALSCFISNIILHEADLAIDRLRRTAEIEYLRYCDDMLILSPDAAACQEAMTAFERVLERKKLPMHAPVDIRDYGSLSKLRSSFWNLKSKRPYLWSHATAPGIPWIQFVGYQIRYDGLVRIREKSLKKHRQKLTDATDKMLNVINPGRKSKNGIPIYAPGLRMSRQKIEHCFKMRLISLSVGRRKFGQPLPMCGPDIMPMCWAKGYVGLWKVDFDTSNLKELDRHRDRQLRRIRNRLSHTETPSGAPKDREKKKRQFYGAPFSYHGQFIRPANGCVVSRDCHLHWIHRRVEGLGTDTGRWLKRFMVSWNHLLVGCLKFFRRLSSDN